MIPPKRPVDALPAPRAAPPTPVEILAQIQSELRTARAHLRSAAAAVASLALVVEPIALAHDLTSGYPWPLAPGPLGLHVRQVREGAGLTRAQLAVLVGIAESTIRNFETGRHKPTKATLAKLLPRLEALIAATHRTPSSP